MKKIITFVLAMTLVASLAIPVCAATPALKAPSIPSISKPKFSIKIELPRSVFTNWFAEHPIKLQ